MKSVSPEMIRTKMFPFEKHFLIILSSFTGSIQNTTIEERVALLESQVMEIEEDVTGLLVDHTQLEGDVNFLFDEQVIQDERILNLEQTSDGIVVELAEVTASIQGKKGAYSWDPGFPRYERPSIFGTEKGSFLQSTNNI